MFALLLYKPKRNEKEIRRQDGQSDIYGDVPKWLKGPHSKCGRPFIAAREFKSPHLRQICECTGKKPATKRVFCFFGGFSIGIKNKKVWHQFGAAMESVSRMSV